MRSIVVIPPMPVVTWEDADQHLHLSGDTSQKAEVEAMIAAATATLDGPDGWLGRALGQQTLEVRLDAWEACNRLTLPFPPVIEVMALTYLDASRVAQTVDSADFELAGPEVLFFSSSLPWEGGLWGREAVRVRYTAGYTTIPPPIRSAILLMVGDLYRYRETAMVVSGMSVPMSTTVANLLAPYRVYS